MSDNYINGNSFENSLNNFISTIQNPLNIITSSPYIEESHRSTIRDMIDALCKLAYANGSKDATLACLEDIKQTMKEQAI